MKNTFHECKCKSFALKSNHRTAGSTAKLPRLIPENTSRDIHVSQNCKCIALYLLQNLRKSGVVPHLVVSVLHEQDYPLWRSHTFCTTSVQNMEQPEKAKNTPHHFLQAENLRLQALTSLDLQYRTNVFSALRKL